MKRDLVLATIIVASLFATACGGDDGITQDGDPAVTVLARADGWRHDLQKTAAFMVIEIAEDDDTAMRAWGDNVPVSLPAADGDPVEPGVYGALEDVDVTRQALVVVSSGGSSSCPPWVTDLATFEDRVEVTLARDGAATACTDDFHPYRLLLAVDRDRLPRAEALPVERIDVPSDNLTDVEGRVVAYPTETTIGEGDGAADPPTAPGDDFDREAVRARAQELLGLPEGEIDESASLRIVRRGEEDFPVTMDLRPGRMNLELDDDGTGTYRVTRVVVEVPDDEDPLVVE